MLDHELLSQSALFDKHIVYRTRTGSMIPRVVDTLSRQAVSSGFFIERRAADLLWTNILLEPAVRFCRCTVADADLTLTLICRELRKTASPIVLTVPHGAKLFDADVWPSVERFCRLVEEEDVNAATMPRLIKGLVQSSGLFARYPLPDPGPLIAHFVQKASEQRFDYLSLEAEFERVVALHVEVKTGACATIDLDPRDRSRAEVYRALRQLIAEPSAATAVQLVQELSRRYRRGDARQDILNGLATASINLLTQRIDDSALVWLVLLLTRRLTILEMGESTIAYRAQPELFVVGLDRLAFEFVRRVKKINSDPLSGLWAALQSVLRNEDPEDEGAAALLAAIRTATDEFASKRTPWVERLENVLGQPDRIQTKLDDRPEQIAPSFASFVGNDFTVRDLQNRLRERAHHVAVVLHGGPGVGKATLARTFGKIYLCEARSSNQSACGTCSSCTAIDGKASLNFIEFECRGGAEQGQRERLLLSKLKRSSLTDRRFVFIRNVDVAPNVVGRMLKTLERMPDDTAIALTARDLSALGGAGLSRCWPYSVHALGAQDAALLLERMLAQRGLTALSEATRELVLYYAKGIPRGLDEATRALGKLPDLAEQSVLKTLGFGDLSWATAHWRLLSSPTVTRREEGVALGPGVTSASGIQSMQSVLIAVRDRRNRVELQPPLRSCAAEIDIVTAQLTERAHTLGMPFDALWDNLALVWQRAETLDAGEFAELAQATRKKLFRDRYTTI